MKVILSPYQLLSSKSLAASFDSDAFECHAYFGLSIQIKITKISSISGTLKAQVSNDGVTWFDFSDFSALTVTDSTDALWRTTTAPMIPCKYMRLDWAKTSGDGTMDALIAGVRA